MKIKKEDFLLVAGRLRAQLEADRCQEGRSDNSNVWIAAIHLLGQAVGENGYALIDRWIYDTECGRFPDPGLGNATSDGEFWDFLSGLDKTY